MTLTDKTKKMQQSYNCPGCGLRIVPNKHLECEAFVCQACLNALIWKPDGKKSRWALEILENS